MGIISEYYKPWEIIVVPIYLVVIFFISYRISQRKQVDNPYYKYFVPGLFFKIAGGLAFTAIYTFYYNGGDCHAYYQGARILNRLAAKDLGVYFSIIGGNTSLENWSFFDEKTGYPPSYLYTKGGAHFAVSRYLSPLLIPSFGSMLIATILINCMVFAGIWKFFKIICDYYPKNEKQIAFSVLFLPSLTFWAGGIMKDTFTYASTLYLTAATYQIFMSRKNVLSNIPGIILSIFLIVTLKPYIILALLPCLGLVIAINYVKEIPNRIVGVIVSPALIMGGLALGIYALSFLSPQMGTYSSVEGVITKAQINQQDLMREEQYGSNNFDIGTFEPTFTGLLKKMPQAVVAGLFRPFMWEARNPVMILSGLENTFILILSLLIIFKIRITKLIRLIIKEPYFLFAFTFSIIFAFSVGISTANFGALVRYKIPMMPFFVSALFILLTRVKEKT